MKTLAIQLTENGGEKMDVLMHCALAELERSGIETGSIRFDGSSISHCSQCRRRLLGDNRYCAITDNPADECMFEMIGADAIILGATRGFADLVTEVFTLMGDAGLAVPQSEIREMLQLCRSINLSDKEVGIAAFDFNNRFLYAKNVSRPPNHRPGEDRAGNLYNTESEEIMRDLGLNLSLFLTNFKQMGKELPYGKNSRKPYRSYR